MLDEHRSAARTVAEAAGRSARWWPCGCPVTAYDRKLWRAEVELRVWALIIRAAVRVASDPESGLRVVEETAAIISIVRSQPPPWKHADA